MWEGGAEAIQGGRQVSWRQEGRGETDPSMEGEMEKKGKSAIILRQKFLFQIKDKKRGKPSLSFIFPAIRS